MTTLADLITRVLRPMRDPNQDLFTDPEMIEYINESVRDLAVRERLIRESASVAPSGGTLALASDMVQVRWAKNPNGVELAWMDESTFFSYQEAFPDWNAEAPIGTIFDEKIYIHPAPADGSGEWLVGYFGIPAVLTADTDTYPLRAQWEDRTVHYVRGQCYYRLDENGLGDRELAMYEKGLRPASNISDHQVPGRVNFSIEPNVFDSHPESIHRGA